MIPLAAVVREDLRLAFRHWAFLAWAGVALAFPLYLFVRLEPAGTATPEYRPPPAEVRYDRDGREIVVAEPLQRDPRQAPLSGSAASLSGALTIRWHLVVWWFFAAAFGAGAIAGEIGIAGDSVLCWGIARWQYFLGKCAARAIAAMMLFVLTTAPMLWLFALKGDGDIAFWPAVRTLSAAATALGAAVVFSVAIGAWFRHPAPAVAAAALLLLAAGALGWWIGSAEWSIGALSRDLDANLRGLEVASSLPKYMFAAAVAWAAASAVRFRFADL